MTRNLFQTIDCRNRLMQICDKGVELKQERKDKGESKQTNLFTGNFK